MARLTFLAVGFACLLAFGPHAEAQPIWTPARICSAAAAAYFYLPAIPLAAARDSDNRLSLRWGGRLYACTFKDAAVTLSWKEQGEPVQSDPILTLARNELLVVGMLICTESWL